MPYTSSSHIEKLEELLRERFEILVAHMQGKEISEEEKRLKHSTVSRFVNPGDIRVAVDDFATILKEIKASLGKR